LERIKGIADMLGRSDGSMIRLRLHSEKINDDLVKILASRMSRNKFLQTLMLHNNAITNDGIEVLCKSLYSHPCLHVLCIADNFLSDAAVSSVCRLLAHNKHISDVNMANKWPGRSWLSVEESVHPYISAKGAKIFANTLAGGQCSLTSLSLQFQRVHDEGAIALFNALPYCNLRTLNLTNNCLTDMCCVELSNALGANVLLEQLVLADNGLTCEGARTICEGLSHNVFLQALSVAHNQIGDEGMAYFLECLDYNHTLTTLACFQNPSKDDRAEELAHDRKMAYRKQCVVMCHVAVCALLTVYAWWFVLVCFVLVLFCLVCRC
jgi:Ran GTPase-activating protein (RanGAP) involved in mRNA processing and transport